MRTLHRGSIVVDSIGGDNSKQAAIASESSRVPLQETSNRIVKRAVDLTVSIPIALLLLPWCALLFLTLHRLWSRGLLLCFQRRVGLNGQGFIMLKFRTMHETSQNRVDQAPAKKTRLFPGALWLRHIGLDEIPQFINVLRGDMSVVGPRPYLPEDDQAYGQLSRRYPRRTLIKPGITGLAQASGLRGSCATKEQLLLRLDLDLYYVEHWSLLLDYALITRSALQIVAPSKPKVPLDRKETANGYRPPLLPLPSIEVKNGTSPYFKRRSL